MMSSAMLVGLALALWMGALPPESDASAPMESVQDAELGPSTIDVQLIREALTDRGSQAARDLLDQAMKAWALESGEALDVVDVDVLLELLGLATELGALDCARSLAEAILLQRQRTLPLDDLDTLRAKESLAIACRALGELQRARGLFEEVLVARTRLLTPTDSGVLAAKNNLAVTRLNLGDVTGAHELFEEVLSVRSRLLPADHPAILGGKQNLATTRWMLGDHVGARELFQQVFDASASRLDEDDPFLLWAKHNLAVAVSEVGDRDEARKLLGEVLQARRAALPRDHPDLQSTQEALAGCLWEAGEYGEAHELLLEVSSNNRLPEEHPSSLTTKLNLSAILAQLGELTQAREIQEEVLAELSSQLPKDHAYVLDAHQNLADTLNKLGDSKGVIRVLSDMLAIVRDRAVTMRSESLRVARGGASLEMQRVFKVLFLVSAADVQQELDAEIFATLESLRATSIAGTEVAGALDEHVELAELVNTVRDHRTAVSNLAASAPLAEGELDEWRRSLLALTEERDRTERQLRTELAAAGAFMQEIDVKGVAARLSPDEAVASFLRYSRVVDTGSAASDRSSPEEALLAFVVRHDGSVSRVELGSAEELEALVEDWRRALDSPLVSRGGRRLEAPESASDLTTSGDRVRARILDPVLAVAPEARSLHMVLDDCLYLVPFDALPSRGGSGLVGDQVVLRGHATLVDLLHVRPKALAGGLLAAGGIDYEAGLEDMAPARLDLASPPLEAVSSRSGTARAAFVPLAEASVELGVVAELYEETHDQKGTILSGAQATKAALLEAAPRTRFLHLATHGWFASESHKSRLDSLSERRSQGTLEGVRDTLVGYAPETLCGLALAGANRGKDVLGQVPGILTAEELSAFDLRACELAVLSACETNVGIRRAGQGIQSLQTALHAAGARTAITSLWRVDDAATRRIFETFYSKLWRQGLGQADALWEAKMALRSEGYPARDWAAWVLTGAAD